MADSPLLGRLLWYELLTTDLDAAETFYTKVAGWTVTPFESAPSRYAMWTGASGRMVGGGMTLPPELKARGVPPHWMLYIGVTNIEEVGSQVTRLGGSRLSPVIDVPTVGRVQRMKDPQGAAFGISQPLTPPQSEALAEVGDVSWIELMTTDGAAAMTFYADVFGWRPTESMDMGPMGTYHMFGRHLGSLGGMMNKPPELAQLPPNWLIYVRVPDIPFAVDCIANSGGQILHDPMEVPGGDWIVQGKDPQGAVFALHAKKN